MTHNIHNQIFIGICCYPFGSYAYRDSGCSSQTHDQAPTKSESHPYQLNHHPDRGMTQRGRSRFLWNIRLSENRVSHDTMFYLHFTHKNRYPAFSDTHILERRLHFFPRWKCWGNDHKEVGKMLGQAMREAWRWKLKAKLWRNFWICLYEKIRYSGDDLSLFMIRHIYIYIHTCNVYIMFFCGLHCWKIAQATSQAHLMAPPFWAFINYGYGLKRGPGPSGSDSKKYIYIPSGYLT